MLASYLTKIKKKKQKKKQKEKQEALIVQDSKSFKISHYNLSHSATPKFESFTIVLETDSLTSWCY